MWPPGLHRISLTFFIWSGLDLAYVVRVLEVMCTPWGVCTCSLFINNSFRNLASRNQLKNALKNNFLNVSYWGRSYFVHASIFLNCKIKNVLVFYLILYFISFYFTFIFTYPYDSWLDSVLRLIYCRTYWLFASHPYDNSN